MVLNLITENLEENFIKSFEGGQPCFFGRIGGSETELICRYYYLKSQFTNYDEFVTQLSLDPLFNNLLESVKHYAGYYDQKNDIHTTIKFCEYYYNSYKNYDSVSIGNICMISHYFSNQNDPNYIDNGQKDLYDMLLNSLYHQNIEAYNYSDLFETIDIFKMCLKVICEKKKVLIIGPFDRSIHLQKDKLNDIIINYQFPQMEILTYKTPITYNTQGTPVFNLPHDNWITTTNEMCKDISKLEFDIALLGCAAYAAPLGSHIKNMGKQAIYVGGILQLYFGILGSRWKTPYYMSRFNQDNLISPIESSSQVSENISKYCVGDGLRAYF